jgi:endogenous inhibitor of DNA gyrase (YacG/DUF329 family)
MIKLPTCPICDKVLAGDAVSAAGDFLPFCSERCRHVDFFRWFEGRYAIEEPLAELPDELENRPPAATNHHADRSD